MRPCVQFVVAHIVVSPKQSRDSRGSVVWCLAASLPDVATAAVPALPRHASMSCKQYVNAFCA